MNDETDNSSYEFGLNSSNFGDLLSSIDQKIQKGPSQLDTSTTTEQIRQVLSELVETVQTRQNLLEQRFDASFQETSVNRSLLPDTSMTNCSLHDSSNLPMFNISIDPKGILTSGRKLLENASSLFSVAPTAKKNVSFLPVNRLSVSSAGSASNFTIFDSPDVRRSFHRSPVCTPHHLRPPLFSHNSGRSVSATLSPQSERSFQENDANLSKVSSVDDFADALEITDFANEEEILNALERSRLIDPTMSFCPSPDSFTSSPEKSFFDSDDSNKQKLQDLLG